MGKRTGNEIKKLAFSSISCKRTTLSSEKIEHSGYFWVTCKIINVLLNKIPREILNIVWHGTVNKYTIGLLVHVYCVTGKSNIKMLKSKLIKNKILEWVKLSPFWIFVQFYKAEHHEKGNLVFSKIRHWSSENSPVFTKIFKLHFDGSSYILKTENIIH